MATELHTFRYDHEKWVLLQKKAKVNGKNVTEIISEILDSFLGEDFEKTLNKKSLSIIDNTYHRVGFVPDMLLCTLSSGTKEYNDLKKYCKNKNYSIKLYNSNETVPVEGTTTGWL